MKRTGAGRGDVGKQKASDFVKKWENPFRRLQILSEYNTILNYNNLISYILTDNSSDGDNVSRFDTLIKNLDYTISPNSRAVIIGALIEQHQFTLA